MLNNVSLMGRITADPDLRYTASGTAVTSFCIAIERSMKAKDGERLTDFINIVAWQGTAEFICKYFHKGDMIAIVGEIQSRNYEDKDGKKRTAYEVLAKQASFCGGGGNKKNEEKSDDAEATEDFKEVKDWDDLPF